MPLDDMSFIVTASAYGFCVPFVVAALLGFLIRAVLGWMFDGGFWHDDGED